jgi:thioredoxin-dependent peroxiredoxin
MRLRSLITAGLALLLGTAGGAQAPGLQAGQTAPGFNLPGSDGKTYNLADYAGKSAVVLAWFPKAFTAG